MATDTARPFENKAVEAAFTAFPEDVRSEMLKLREMIFDVAESTEGVGQIEETLKWGQPSYLTSKPKSGSTIRLGIPKQGGYALYAHCQTTIISDFAAVFGDEFETEGNRAVVLRPGMSADTDKLGLLIANALTYHLK